MYQQDKSQPAYAALGCISNFSFLRGASHPYELIETAAAEGWSSCGIADYHTISGLVRAHQSAVEHSVKLLCGTRLIIDCSEQVVTSEQTIQKHLNQDALVHLHEHMNMLLFLWLVYGLTTYSHD